MIKEQQDLNWACLPKEARKEIRLFWELDTLPVHPDYDSDSVAEGAAYILTELFGYHNLTSDTEPEEVLMVSRKEVQDRVKTFSNPNWASNEEETYGAQLVIDTLDLLFGDKCLPDKEVLTAKNVTESVIAQPKTLNVGDKVKIIGSGTEAGKAKIGEVGEILDIDTQNNACFVLYRKGQDWVRACDLEPYTEENKETMEEKQSSLDADFKRANEILDKMQKTVAKIYDSYGKMRVAVDKLKRL